MGRKKDVSIAKRAQASLLHDQGWSQRKIAEFLDISRCGVRLAIEKKRWNPETSFKSAMRPGRKKKTSVQTDRAIVRFSKLSPRSSSAKIQAGLPKTENVSLRTVRRRLFNAGLKSRKPARKPLLTSKNIADRMAFCQKYQDWSEDQWENVFFSDESTFTQFYAFCRHVRRPVNTRYDKKYCTANVKQAAKIMVWGAFSGKGGRGPLWFMPPNTSINGLVYKNLLEEKLLDFMEIQEVEFFLHDGAPAHTAKITNKWLSDNHVNVVGPWPGSSPDLNPIENLWMVMKTKVAAHSPTSAEHLKQIIKQVWVTETPKDYCRTLARSMPRRIAVVLAAKGESTKY